MKPATPLLTYNAPKSSISREQRCHRFHRTTKTGPQRCQRFQPGIVLHRRGKQCTRAYTVARATRQCAYPRSAMPLRNAITGVRPRPIIPHAIPTQPNPASTQNPQNSNDQTSNHETHSRELHAKLLDQQGQLHRNLAHNSIGRSFNKVRKRCNSNDLNSMFERVTGELRAKLLSGGRAWPGFETTRRAAEQRPGPTGVEGAGGTGGPGSGAGGWRQGQGGPRDRPLRAAGSRVAISRAGRRPPTHTAAGPHKASQDPCTA